MSDLGQFDVNHGVEDEKYTEREKGVEDQVEPHHVHLGDKTKWKKIGDAEKRSST